MAQFTDNTISSVADLMTAIGTFMTGTAGFTQDEAPPASGNGQAGWHIGDLFIQTIWTTQNSFTIHQSTGAGIAPLSPGNEAGDSSHPADVDLFGVSLTQGQVWGFTNGDTAPDNQTYAHFVLEFNRDGRFAHFGWGHIVDKYGNWTGGAYKYGFVWNSAAADDPSGANHRLLLDSNHSGTTPAADLATMRISGHPAQAAGSKWAVFTSSAAAIGTTDQEGQTVHKAHGYTRHGPWPETFLNFRGNPNNASILHIPVEIAIHNTSTSQELLGRMPAISIVNIGNIQPKDLITLGSKTYRFFPWASKQTNAGAGVMASRHGGIAYELE